LAESHYGLESEVRRTLTPETLYFLIEASRSTMIKGLYCQNCGDKWSRVFHESYVRVGPPKRECRACWTMIPTGAKEWADMGNGARAGFFLQNMITLVIPTLIFAAAWGICFVFLLADDDSLAEFGTFGLASLGGWLLILWLIAAFKVLVSLRRTAKRTNRGSFAASTEANSKV